MGSQEVVNKTGGGNAQNYYIYINAYKYQISVFFKNFVRYPGPHNLAVNLPLVH